jgi:hypothetical protein
MRLIYWAECSCDSGQQELLMNWNSLIPYFSEEHCSDR